MDNFLIVANENKRDADKITSVIRDYLLTRGHHVTEDPASAACVLVLGGDGTMLRTAARYAHLDVPFLGINLGNLGFLAEVDRDHIEAALERLIADEYEIERRMMLQGVIGSGGEGATALNDIVIAAYRSVQLIYFDLYVNGLKLSSYVADGMIISTPTGSTGYNLSAGGPIALPGAGAILLTPLCAHSIRSRSIILAADDEVVIEIGRAKNGGLQEAEAVFDGHHRVGMATGDLITISKSAKTTAIVKLSKTSFLEVLRAKL